MELQELEEKLKNFKEEREQQKLRGLNNYNIMKVLRKPHAEVGMHSNFIYSLLNIYGDHYQGDLFAKLFVEHTLDIKDFGKIIEVEMEADADGRRIDFTIKSDAYYIGIEMKIHASDQDEQIFDYYKKLDKEKSKEQEVIIYYLTLDGKEASADSYVDKPYKRIAFDNEILKWLEKSKEQVANITNLNSAIGYYTDIVKMLIGNPKNPVKQFKDFFLDKDIYECYEKNEKNIENNSLVKDGFIKAKQKLYNDYYDKLLNRLFEENDDIKFDYYDIDNNKIVLNFQKYFELWIIMKDNNFKSIGIRSAWSLKWQGNKELTKILNESRQFLTDTKGVQDYIIGTKKGVDLKFNFNLPLVDNNNLFSSSKKLENIDGIQEHIYILVDLLKTK